MVGSGRESRMLCLPRPKNKRVCKAENKAPPRESRGFKGAVPFHERSNNLIVFATSLPRGIIPDTGRIHTAARSLQPVAARRVADRWKRPQRPTGAANRVAANTVTACGPWANRHWAMGGPMPHGPVAHHGVGVMTVMMGRWGELQS